MLEVYGKEFVAIGTYLISKGNKKGDYIIVTKTELEELLDKNQYDTARNKLKIWKALGWIDADKDRRYTRRIYIKEEHSYMTCVKMSNTIWELLRELCKQPQKPG